MRKILLHVVSTWLAFQTPAFAQVVINEICPANADVRHDPDFFNFSPWVELFNSGTTNVNVGGYFLTDDATQTSKWVIPAGVSIPAKQYLLIWCDQKDTGLHTNFSLDSEGERLLLLNPAQQIVDQITFPQQYTNISFGRISDGGTNWSYLADPTPLAPNVSVTATTQQAKPSLSLPPGRYSSSTSVSLSAEVGSEIRYTLDGSEPTRSSFLFTGPITISQTRTLKARAFGGSKLPSQTTSATYFINEHAFSLPIVSISTKPAYLWNDQIGIYTNGTNGIPGNCQGNPVNWNQDWSRHASFELFDKNGTRKFQQPVDIKINGGCSRNNPQKSFAIRARDKYGSNVMEQKFFSTKRHESYGGFALRNSGNDFNVTMFRDALMQSLTIGQMDVDHLAYEPAAFYLNGEYWGIQNIREKVDGDYIEANYGIKKQDIDLLELWGNPLEGTSDAYTNYLATLSSMDLTSSSAFAFIDSKIDVQEYINYVTTQIYVGNTDWPGNNIKFWRHRSPQGKFRWILFDLDFGFELFNFWSYATHPTLDFATDPDSGVGWPNPPWATQHLRLLLQNPEFKNRFIQTLTTARNTVFQPQRIHQFINDFQQKIGAEMPYHKQRWGGDMDGWNFEIQRLRDFAVHRHQFMGQHIKDFFSLPEQIYLSVLTSSTGTARLNGITLEQPLLAGEYCKGVPYQLEPLPSPGYSFKHWIVRQQDVTSVSLIAQNQSWKYYDAGNLPALDWNTGSYADQTWSQGNAQLGYGDGDEQTIVDFGSNPSNKYITTYFRKQFTVTDASALTTLQGAVLFDDGVVVYVNGTEVYRNNLPAGMIGYSTLANQAIAVENTFHTFLIPPSILVDGQNTVAIEIHQNAVTSSDISFDFTLSALQAGNQQETVVTEQNLKSIAFTNVEIEAVFEEATEIEGLVINEISASNNSVPDEFGGTDDWIELYNNGSQPIELGNLFVSDNLRSRLKYQIPSGTGQTKLAPGSYVLLWADKQTGQGPLHLHFQLSSEGEEVGIYQLIGNNVITLDETEFPSLNSTLTFARIPNGTGPFLPNLLPTPYQENKYVTGLDPETDFQLSVFPNPTDGTVHIQCQEEIQEIRVFNMIGTKLLEKAPKTRELEISLVNQAGGLYFLQIRLSNQTKVIKIIRN
jgi:hypothetical protein